MAITSAVCRAVDVEEKVVSISLEPVAEQDRDERVHQPETTGRREFLRQAPNY